MTARTGGPRKETMSNVIHYNPGCHCTLSLGKYETACGGWHNDASSDRSRVTCKRCLASLAKRDREFQQKSRAGMTHLNYIGWAARQPGVTGEAARKRNMLRNSVRAIAREEGRAL